MLNDQPVNLSEPELKAGTRVLIVKSNYNGPNDELLKAFEAAKQELTRRNVLFDVVMVPGSLEIPDTIADLINADKQHQYDGFVALGAILPAHYRTDSKGKKKKIWWRRHTAEQKANLSAATTALQLWGAFAVIGRAIISHTQDRTPEQWGVNAVKACLNRIEFQQKKLGKTPVRPVQEQDAATEARPAPLG